MKNYKTMIGGAFSAIIGAVIFLWPNSPDPLFGKGLIVTGCAAMIGRGVYGLLKGN